MNKLYTMMMLCICTYATLKAQVIDNFSDGDMSVEPSWDGDIIKFEIDASQKLHLNAAAEASQAYLSTISEAVGESEWSWYGEIHANPSSSNYCKVYLISDQAALNNSLNGYFVKIGGTQDEVSLYRQDGLSETLIIDGIDGRVNTSLVQIHVKVNRDLSGNWTLWVKTATDPEFIVEGNAFDNTHTISAFFGVYCQYTSTRASAFYFDDFNVIGSPIPDLSPPTLINHLLSSSHEIKMKFSEALSPVSALIKENYFLNGKNPTTVNYTDDTIILEFPIALPNGISQQMVIKNIADEYLNVMPDTTITVLYFEKVKAKWGSLVINEIFPDPTPSILNLPDDSNAEFIEIYNPGTEPFDVLGWSINSKPLPTYILQPKEYVILCKPDFEEEFQKYAHVLSLSDWPTLSNSGGSLILLDEELTVVDSTAYTFAQILGGFSLERIYLVPTCGTQVNFELSKHINGASPGEQNSIFSDEEDILSPELVKLEVLGEDSILLTFSEKTYLPQPLQTQIIINETICPKIVEYISNDSSQFIIIFEKPLTSNKTHHIKITDASDCSGNANVNISQSFYLDLLPPSVSQIVVLDTTEILMHFSEKILKSGAENENNYTLYPFGSKPTKAVISEDSISVQLTFASSLDIQDSVGLIIHGISDVYNNIILSTHPVSSTFIYHSQIDTILIVNAYQIDVKFEFIPNATAVEHIMNYEIDRAIGNPAKVIQNTDNPQLVHLLLQSPLNSNKSHTLTFQNLTDLNNSLQEIPKYHFYYDTKGPVITQVDIDNEKEVIVHFNEIIYFSEVNDLSVWIDNNKADLEDYVLKEDQLRLMLKEPLIQEKVYVLGIGGIEDNQSNISDTIQNFTFLIDQLPPRLDTAFVYSSHELMLIFNEAVMAETLNADVFLQFIQPAFTPQSIQFYQLTPEKVLFKFREELNDYPMHFQVNNFIDGQNNSINKPIEYRINLAGLSVGHIIPLSKQHLELTFNTDIINEQLNLKHFLINNLYAPDSLTITSAHQIELWFKHTLNEYTDYQLQFSYNDTFQFINFQYDNFIEDINHENKANIIVHFEVPMDENSTENVGNYLLDSTYVPLAAIYLPEIQSVQLFFKDEINEQKLHTLSIGNLLNIDLFPLPDSEHFFGKGRIPSFQDILITEIMAKPSPAVALPEAEYIEIFNATEHPLQLQGLTLADAQKKVVLKNHWLAPGAYLILCSSADVESLSAHGLCMAVSGFPNLNDDTDTLSILNAKDEEIHSIAYSKSWYNHAVKALGGWSLEMIDTAWPCQEMHNWQSSVSMEGGTPGQVNSVQQSNPDLQPPNLLQAIAIDSLHLSLAFDEKIDPYSIDKVEVTLDGIELVRLSLNKQAYELKIELDTPLKAGLNYTLKASHFADCSGNIQQAVSLFEIRIADAHQRDDILVSEILFHPRTGGVDFVELYNYSDKYINLKHWKLATLKNDLPEDTSIFSDEPLILAPGKYLAITNDINVLIADYPMATHGDLFESKTFPSLLADGGVLLLLDDTDQIMQEISFSPDWHHPLLHEQRGVSLERISWNPEENNRNYWQSAASSAGYATPGYQNSQWQNLQSLSSQLFVDPPIFYPDQTAHQDFTNIRFQFAGAGNIGNLKIFDARGRMIRKLAQHQSLSEEGFFTWDGTDDFKKRVNIGYYIIWMEVFKPDGTVNILKSKVVVGSKF